jgi:hypothetical protein
MSLLSSYFKILCSINSIILNQNSFENILFYDLSYVYDDFILIFGFFNLELKKNMKIKFINFKIF